MKNRMWQSVIITLSDGSEHHFTGPAVFYPGEKRLIKAELIRFTTPRRLPRGCYFEEVKK